MTRRLASRRRLRTCRGDALSCLEHGLLIMRRRDTERGVAPPREAAAPPVGPSLPAHMSEVKSSIWAKNPPPRRPCPVQ